MAGVDRDRVNRRRRLPEQRRRLRRRRRRRLCRLRRRRRRLGLHLRQQIDHQTLRRVHRLRGGAEAAEPRTEIDRHRRPVGEADGLHDTLRRLRGQRRVRRIERVGVELDRQVIAVLRYGRSRARRGVDRQPRGVAERIVADRNPRHAHVADHEQARRFPEIEPCVVDQRERAADELDRDEPAASAARRRRRQRHEPARHRCQRLVGREDDRLSLVRHRNGAERVFTNGDLERRREIVQRDEFLVGDDAERERAAAVLREHRERGRLRRLAREDGGDAENKRERGGG